MKPAILAAAACLLAAAPARAACDKPVPVRFPAGMAFGEVAGGIPRGDRDCFTIGARAGQRLTVTQPTKGEGNIVFQLYQPPWKTGRDNAGLVVTGASLKGASEGDDAARWTGPLPVNGSYLLVVGATRGGGEYRIRIEIQ